MTNYGLYIIFTKPNVPKYELLNFVCSSLEECYNKLIVNIKNKINMNIDFPSDLDDFAYLHWYNNYSMDNEIFDYNVFSNNEWTKPWTLQELYENILEIIHQVDLQNSIYNDRNYYDYVSDSDESK